MIFPKDLEVGSSYRFCHKRKGEFVAKLLDKCATDEGDTADEMLLKVLIPTAAGSGQERLAGGMTRIKGQKVPLPETIVCVRPSLLEKVEAV